MRYHKFEIGCHETTSLRIRVNTDHKFVLQRSAWAVAVISLSSELSATAAERLLDGE